MVGLEETLSMFARWPFAFAGAKPFAARYTASAVLAALRVPRFFAGGKWIDWG